MKKSNIAVNGFEGTYKIIETMTYANVKIHVLESEQEGNKISYLAMREDKVIIHDNIEDGDSLWEYVCKHPYVIKKDYNPKLSSIQKLQIDVANLLQWNPYK